MTLNAAPPGGFISVTAQAQAPFGAASPCYWVVPNFPIGHGPVSAPACTPPTVGSQVLASWNAVTGATSYDLLRTNSAVLPGAGISSNIAVATAIAGTTFTDTFGALLAYTVNPASAATAVFLLDNQNQAAPQVRVTISNATSSNSFLLGAAGAGSVSGPGTSMPGFVPSWVGTTGTQLGTGYNVTALNAPNALVMTNAGGTISTSAAAATNILGGTNAAVVYQSAPGVTAFLTGNIQNNQQVLISSGNGTVTTGLAYTNAPGLNAANFFNFNAPQRVKDCQAGIGMTGTGSTTPLGSGSTYIISGMCVNDFGATFTITAIACYNDAGSSTGSVSDSSSNPLVTAPITGGSGTWANGTLSGTTTIAPGAWMNFTFTGDGITKQITCRVVGTF